MTSLKRGFLEIATRSVMLSVSVGTLLVISSSLASAKQRDHKFDFRMLAAPACEASDARWLQIKGPRNAQVLNAGPISRVQVHETGNYQFELTCCAVDTVATRAQRLLSSPNRIGFGAPTTGGADAAEFTVVTTLNDSGRGSLREALRAEGPRWIVFDKSIHNGTIYLKSPIRVKHPNFTIDGNRAGITISPRSTNLKSLLVLRSGNGIIHDLTFDGRGFKASQIMLREGDFYWLDHLTIFDVNYLNNISVGQGSKGDTSASEVTISAYHAYNSNYAILGGGQDYVVNYPPYRITIHSSNLQAKDRNPRIKNHGTVHAFNNYIHSFTYTGLSAGQNSTIYSEHNVFSAETANNPTSAMVSFSSNGQKAGTVYSKNDAFIGAASWRGDVRQTESSPNSILYTYPLIDPSEVINHVLSNAGAGVADLDYEVCQVFNDGFSYTPNQ